MKILKLFLILIPFILFSCAENFSEKAKKFSQEKIIIDTETNKHRNRVGMNGVITNWTYYGDISYITIELKNKTKFYINVQNIHRNSLQELNLGKKLSASFDINDLIILEK